MDCLEDQTSVEGGPLLYIYGMYMESRWLGCTSSMVYSISKISSVAEIVQILFCLASNTDADEDMSITYLNRLSWFLLSIQLAYLSAEWIGESVI